MIAEAIDTAVTLGWAFAIWFVLVCLASALALHALLALAWWAARALWRAAPAAWRTAVVPTWARSRREARRIARATRDYEEAA